jgi:diguanylate cyclase (GGDEF)-like protein
VAARDRDAVAGLVVIALTDRLVGLIARLGHAARTDPLTGLPNRRAFTDALDLELERTRRGAGPLCLVLGDLDDFKQVNDQLGHSEGDYALERVAAVLDDGKRRIDTAARIGGEEFAIVLPSCDPDGARTLADRLRREIAAEFRDSPQPLTASFGIATAHDGARTKRALFDEADRALYRAKAQGGDRCVFQRPAGRATG